ncbi:hypothetical protein GS8_2844 [Geobacillus stearothermophilus]|uniref:Uncharacterized protein n=1 Tax=Geobacillus stearothermophilus TaxID=1422 RepID=A0ABQ7HEW7_GEOSE|nr:hypothetical protein GS8_2844 [Geobacillus stearothermophilus]
MIFLFIERKHPVFFQPKRMGACFLSVTGGLRFCPQRTSADFSEPPERTTSRFF